MSLIVVTDNHERHDNSEATRDDAPAIARIYNQGIEERGATFETELRTPADIASRLAEADRFPMLVADEDGTILGWAGLTSYRARACYAGIAEFSIYLDRDARGRGTGRRLLAALVDTARDRAYWKLVSRVFPPMPPAARSAPRAVFVRSACTRSMPNSTVNGWMSSSSNA